MRGIAEDTQNVCHPAQEGVEICVGVGGCGPVEGLSGVWSDEQTAPLLYPTLATVEGFPLRILVHMVSSMVTARGQGVTTG
jgi:hypothetical protein